MEKINIQNFKKYYRNVDSNATLACVSYINYVIEGLTKAVTKDYVFITGLGAAFTLNKIKNYNITIQENTSGVYSLADIRLIINALDKVKNN